MCTVRRGWGGGGVGEQGGGASILYRLRAPSLFSYYLCYLRVVLLHAQPRFLNIFLIAQHKDYYDGNICHQCSKYFMSASHVKCVFACSSLFPYYNLEINFCVSSFQFHFFYKIMSLTPIHWSILSRRKHNSMRAKKCSSQIQHWLGLSQERL